ncbi:membrane protein [[Clostridium] sordellii]|uniref:hypothetical protein n=1 Tax=Paraclostridium sordellii TaxID=1505 RepID=UPI0005DDB530|nr:hypothetical protein [Paeniclostridium sordellii]CEN88566.1 membrane protein [[Clostridium] sordellii] [Paeniclostridium sordellii]CEO25082.1 membrane protein [[Clostridium] sordellii] [Paeniclostridium sordellii]CEP45027.1 membrane protein [[Clostridium] sordellii] [Paeniclostridium sordellii]
MKKKIVSLLTTLIVLISSMSTVSFAEEKGKVILINMNRTSLDDMLSIQALSKKVENEGYIGLMNIRGDRGTDDRRSYAAIGAGGRVTMPSQSLINFEELNKDNGPVYKAETGHNPKKINDMTINYSLSENLENGSYGSKLGSLGQTLADKKIKTSVIGNADKVNNGELLKNRNIALMAMDNIGRVENGNVDNINIKDNTMPYGISTDYNKLKSDTKKFYDNSDVLFVELGDTYRLDEYKDYLNEKTYKEMKLRIYNKINSYLEEVFKMANKNDTIYITSTFPSNEDYKNQKRLSPIIKFDGSSKGVLKSATTRREGVVGNIDIGVDILSKFGLVNENMLGKKFIDVKKANNVEFINHEFEKMVSMLGVRSTIVNTSVGIVAAAWVICTILLVFFRNKIPKKEVVFKILKEIVKLGILLPLAFILAPIFNLSTKAGITMGIVGTLIGLYIIGKIFFKKDMTYLMFFSLMTIIVIVIDSIFGTHLMQNNIMSYDAIIGARYYGVGNEYEGVTIGCAIFALSVLLNYKKIPRWVVIMFALVILITSAYPSMGANVGGCISESVAYVLFILLIFDVKMDLKKSILLGLVPVILVGLFATLDIVSKSQSHLSGFVNQIMVNGPGAIIQTFTRKIQMNVDIATSNIFIVIALIVAGFMSKFIFKPSRHFKKLADKYPYVFKGFVAIIVGCIVALIFNDSGIVAAGTGSIYILIPLLVMSVNMMIFDKE